MSSLVAIGVDRCPAGPRTPRLHMTHQIVPFRFVSGVGTRGSAPAHTSLGGANTGSGDVVVRSPSGDGHDTTEVPVRSVLLYTTTPRPCHPAPPTSSVTVLSVWSRRCSTVYPYFLRSGVGTVSVHPSTPKHCRERRGVFPGVVGFRREVSGTLG